MCEIESQIFGISGIGESGETGDYFINHEIRIPFNQPGFNGKYPSCFFGGAQIAPSHGSEKCG